MKCSGADPVGGTPPARAPPKIGKNMIFWREIVIFHTKYPKKFPASLSSLRPWCFHHALYFINKWQVKEGLC